MKLLRQLLISLLLTGLAIAAWAWMYPNATLTQRLGLHSLLATEAPSSPQGGGGFGRGGPTTVVVAPLRDETVVTTLRTIATASATTALDLAFPIGGTLATLPEPTASVTTDTVLFTLDDTAQRLETRRTAQTLERARTDLERATALFERGVSSDVVLQDAQEALTLAEIAHDTALFDLSLHTLTAPFAGTLNLFTLSPGQRVAAQTPLATLQQVDPLVLRFALPERAYAAVSPNQPITVTPLSTPNITLKATLARINPQIDPASRTFQVEATLPNTDHTYQPGMAFETTVSFTGDTAYALPSLSVRWDDGGAYVWLVREDMAIQLPIELVQIQSETILAKGAFAPGDQVIVEGLTSLRPNSPVRIAP